MGLSGGFAPFSAMPQAVRWLQWISPFKYSLQALAVGHFGKDSPFAAALELDTPGSVSSNTAVLYLIFGLFSVASVVILKGKREVR